MHVTRDKQQQQQQEVFFYWSLIDYSLDVGSSDFSRVKSFLPKQAACNDINTVYFWKIKQEISGHFYPPPLIINKLDAKCFFGMKPFTY